MGIFDALNTSVGGLQAQSFALQNISGNIANASTTGYKGIGTSFEDLIPDATTPSRQVAGGVTAFAQATITTQGTVSATTVATNMAINGDGFFSVQKASAVVDNVPVFTGVTDYTRRGDFQVNANGNLINGAGYYLMGVTVDPKTGNPTGNVPQVLQFQNNFIPAQSTTAIQYAANLPTTPKTPASSGAQAGTITAGGGINPADFASNPLPLGTPAPPVNASATGAARNNDNTTPAAITAATQLVGTASASSNDLATAITNGSSLTVDGKTITFSTGQTTSTTNASGNVTIGIGPGSTLTVQSVLSAIDGITGASTSSTVNGSGQLVLSTGTNQDLVISGTGNALAALGLSAGTTVRAAGTNPGTGIVTGNDLTAFTNESISGGAVTAFNAAGTPINVQLRWAKTDSASLGTGHQDTWNLFYQTSTTATGAQTAWVNTGTNFVFNANGSLASPAGSAISVPAVSVDGQVLGNLTFNIGAGTLTQFASTAGAATINNLTQNGFAAGQLQSVAINNSGIVVGTFSNGQNIDLAQVTLSHFNGTNYLKALDGGAYEVTDLSGPAIAGASGQISGSSLEGSNTDIADEFTKLIVTQQAYSANTKVITTANNMVQDLLNVLR
ncbi:MAG: flagellar hook-basal body complex protein [Alphaproteobacteria bacterium]|nr:MAG: flagellar hook-basal body complex protein [Alphaproteobacteria bacterium]